MRFEIKKSFSRDVDKIRNKKILKSIEKTIRRIENAVSPADIEHIEKISIATSPERQARGGAVSHSIT